MVMRAAAFAACVMALCAAGRADAQHYYAREKLKVASDAPTSAPASPYPDRVTCGPLEYSRVYSTSAAEQGGLGYKFIGNVNPANYIAEGQAMCDAARGPFTGYPFMCVASRSSGGVWLYYAVKSNPSVVMATNIDMATSRCQ